ncbi:hypothetical protein AB0P17_17735 [Streptomyces sp. NPDC088124]|uniref:hypothetical protein n=1 Tax=Streptomyces sp. NPDC088124 TaxID=3154654 RepID=UPI00342A0292
MHAQDSVKAPDRTKPQPSASRTPSSAPRPAAFSPGAALTPGVVTALQQSAGNAAVSLAVQRQTHGAGHGRSAPAQRAFGTGVQRAPDREEHSREYTHVAIDKQDKGLEQLRLSLNTSGLKTAASLDIKLSEGSEKMGHHKHVFMWDATVKGLKGVTGIVESLAKDSTVNVKIRMLDLSQPGVFSKGNLKGDRPEGLGGKSTNGAWAHEGDIPRKYLFIEGLDQPNQSGFKDWLAGKGWPDDHAAQFQRDSD